MNAPVTSMMTWVSEYVKMQILPPSPIFAVTGLEIVCPAA